MHACGMQPRSLMYQGLDHAQFVTDWHPQVCCQPVQLIQHSMLTWPLHCTGQLVQKLDSLVL